ncbi:DUF5691 domain-containing protein [Luteolibacter arcticus]|uniref:DUF5691 domain-containing protein n=1 Tax=Luteolibacter arcticus TaxID=1581411 RepID=A0ABT3GJC4_9BACT|nr:DUF5691 domain-containing protein [Luteolibacter arcticus]MCW1923608.1 DUF5691 domain-containing protein [Luteolibacter arcticus]
MMTDPLLSAALLGTARLTTLPPPSDPLLETTWQAIDTANPAAAVLQALAVTRAMKRAGVKALAAPEAADPCPLESHPELPPPAVDAGMRLLKGEYPELLPEWLRLAEQSNRVVPGRVLPELLAAASKDRALRPAVRGIAGERGRWIAKRLAEFVWLLEDEAVPDHAWDEGLPAERIAWLRQTRAVDPERAATAISAQWSGEEPAMRENIVRQTAASPQPCDEPWLEELALKDRRQDTRDLAAAALSQLEGSAFRRRALERVRGLVKIERRLLKRVIAVEPPAAFDASWTGDGLKEKPPQGTGEKAWWLRQAVALVPLSDWPELLGCKPDELFTLSIEGDWREPLLLGWIDSARRLPSRAMPEHSLPFLATREPWPVAALPKHLVLAGVLDAMPATSRFAVLDGIAKHLPPLIVLDLFARIGEAPPPGSGKTLLALLDQAVSTHPASLTRPQARALAVCVPKDGIQARLEAIAKLPELSAAAEEFATTLEFRRSLLSHFATP